MYKEMGLALYRDLYRSLTIRISKYRFNVKKHRGLYLNFSNGLRKKVLSLYPILFKNVNDVADMTCRRFMQRYKVVNHHFAHLCFRSSLLSYICLFKPKNNLTLLSPEGDSQQWNYQPISPIWIRTCVSQTSEWLQQNGILMVAR